MSKPQECTRMTSGSVATTWSQSSHGEVWPATPNKFSPPAICTSSRHPVATGHQWIDPLDHGGARTRSRRAALLRDAGHAGFQLFDQTLAFAPERPGDFNDVLPDIAE